MSSSRQRRRNWRQRLVRSPIGTAFFRSWSYEDSADLARDGGQGNLLRLRRPDPRTRSRVPRGRRCCHGFNRDIGRLRYSTRSASPCGCRLGALIDIYRGGVQRGHRHLVGRPPPSFSSPVRREALVRRHWQDRPPRGGKDTLSNIEVSNPTKLRIDQLLDSIPRV